MKSKSTLKLLAKVADPGRVALPEYLARQCPIGLRHGRMLKTQLRLGTHQLAVSKARMVPAAMRDDTHSQCKCCSAGVAETVQHAMFECSCYDDVRDEFLDRVRRIDPLFGMASTETRLRVLLGDDTPKEIDNVLYRFLINIFASREELGWILWPPGVGLRGTPYCGRASAIC